MTSTPAFMDDLAGMLHSHLHVELDSPLPSGHVDDEGLFLDDFDDSKGSSLSDLSLKIGTTVHGKTTTYHLDDLLGVGTFAAVYLATDNDGEQYAIKTLFKRGLTPEQLDVQRLESDIHEAVKDVPNVVKLYDMVEDPECLYLVLEYCQDDLYNLIQTPNHSLPDRVVKRLFSQVGLAIHGMHHRGIYHRDLKPENVLLGKDGRARVADFGLATREEWCRELACGTRSYLAPEALDEELDGYHPGPADVWALGVVLVNMRFKCKVWDTADPLVDPYYREYLSVGPHAYFSTNFPGFTPALISILTRVFSPNPELRPTALELVNLITAKDLEFWMDPAKVKEEEAMAKNEREGKSKPIEMGRSRRGREHSCDSGFGASLKQQEEGTESTSTCTTPTSISSGTDPIPISNAKSVTNTPPSNLYRPPFKSSSYKPSDDWSALEAWRKGVSTATTVLKHDDNPGLLERNPFDRYKHPTKPVQASSVPKRSLFGASSLYVLPPSQPFASSFKHTTTTIPTAASADSNKYVPPHKRQECHPAVRVQRGGF